MKYVGVRGKGAKVQSKQRKLPTKSKSDSSLKSSKNEKRSRQSQSKTEHKDRLKEKSSKPVEAKALIDAELSLTLLKEQLSTEWFDKCKAEMKPHKHARIALKALHQAGQEKKRIKRIIPDISSAIEKISDIKGDEKRTWKNALWRFVSQFSECDAIQLVKIYEQSNKPSKTVKKDKSEEKKPTKDKEQLRREKREREEKKKKHRAELKRQYESSQKQGASSSSHHSSSHKRNSDDRKRKHASGQGGGGGGGTRDSYKQGGSSWEKYKRFDDPPAAPSMF